MKLASDDGEVFLASFRRVDTTATNPLWDSTVKLYLNWSNLTEEETTEIKSIFMEDRVANESSILLKHIDKFNIKPPSDELNGYTNYFARYFELTLDQNNKSMSMVDLQAFVKENHKRFHNVININTIEELIQHVKKSSNIFFRGVSNATHDLIPSIARLGKSREEIESIEKDIFALFKLEAAPYINKVPDTEWEWLMLAQHHGLNTRLLDWSRNPLIGAYFASLKYKNEKDGAIWCASIEFMHPDECKNLLPYDVEDVRGVFPYHISPRIKAQDGVFTCHPTSDLIDSKYPLNLSLYDKYIIPKDKKEEFQKDLKLLGINHSTVFPEIDGLCKFFNERY